VKNSHNLPPLSSPAPSDVRQKLDAHNTSPEFTARYGGLNPDDLAARARYEVVFAELMHPIWASLQGKRVLDIGCGNGRWLRWCLELGADPAQIVGVDISSARFSQGLERNPLIRFECIDGKTLPFADESFDLVMQWTCFTSMPDAAWRAAWRAAMAQEVERVLAKDGYLFWLDMPFAHPTLSDHLPMHLPTLFPRLPIASRRVPIPHAAAPITQPLKMLGHWLRNAVRTHQVNIAARIGPKQSSA